MSVAALFNNALEYFQYVRIGRDFERDAETYQAKLNLIQLRLSQWGEVVGLDRITEHDKSLFPSSYVDVATCTLEQIVRLFEDVEKKSKDFSRRASESDFTAHMKEMCTKMRSLSMNRKNKSVKTSFSTRTKWALVGRQEYSHLVDSVSGLVNELIAAFPAETFIKKQEEIRHADAVELFNTNKDALELLKDAMGEQDERLRDALAKLCTPVVHHNSATFSGANNQGVNLGQNLGNSTFDLRRL
ncbi:prion-inhibition and propagation-domain-containing protein [Ampelomyces quisqualis]|uniref:Prion-inhibition and propagation-domain-containing protein n=1 Tax=Ampelomyces quisqualis TaxID=50730 RepID=A0A6A5QMK0_AMPQU|nr:prion-inhibition and propagation-domain-containing protein [Ampelomyces quisqualis]